MLIIVKTYNTQTHPLGTVHFFMRGGGGLVGFGGGALEKNWLERGGQPKKNEGKGGGRTKKLD